MHLQKRIHMQKNKKNKSVSMLPTVSKRLFVSKTEEASFLDKYLFLKVLISVLVLVLRKLK